MGGLKRKIPIQKRETKQQRSVAFSKRRHGLYKKAAELCVRFDAQIAVIATGPSENNRDCFYSFGHSSVDNVVDAFLQNRRPVNPAANAADNSIVSVDETLERRSSSTTSLLEQVLSEGFGYGQNLEELTASLDILRRLKDEVTRKIHGGETKYDDPNPLNSFGNSDRVDQMNTAVVNSDSSVMENSLVGDSLPSQLGFTRDQFDQPPAPPTASSDQRLTNSDEGFISGPENSYGNGGPTSHLLCANPNPQNSFGYCDDVDQMNATAVIDSDYNSPSDDSFWSQLEFILDDCELPPTPPTASSNQTLTDSDEGLIFASDQGIDQYENTNDLVVMESGHHLYPNPNPNPHLNPNEDPGANLSGAQLMVEDDVSF